MRFTRLGKTVSIVALMGMVVGGVGHPAGRGYHRRGPAPGRASEGKNAPRLATSRSMNPGSGGAALRSSSKITARRPPHPVASQLKNSIRGPVTDRSITSVQVHGVRHRGQVMVILVWGVESGTGGLFL